MPINIEIFFKKKYNKKSLFRYLLRRDLKTSMPKINYEELEPFVPRDDNEEQCASYALSFDEQMKVKINERIRTDV